MKKPAKTDFDIHPVLNRRYSPRTFEDRMIEEDKLDRIFEAARWAPSSLNDQPWHILVGVKGLNDVYDKIFSSLLEFNQIWARLAPVLVVMVADKISRKTNKTNHVYLYDTGQAAAHLSMQAMAEDVFVHQMGGFDKDKLISTFSIPERFEPVTAIAMGYAGKLENLPEKFQEMEKAERTRKSQKEFVFRDGWRK